MGNVDRALWKQLYEEALAEDDPTAISAKTEVALEAVDMRLRMLPRGLPDYDEMRDLNEARKKLIKRRNPNSSLESLPGGTTVTAARKAVLGWRTWVSVGLCGAIAAVSSLLFRASPERSVLPFVCLAIVVFVGSRFGATAGILGSLLAAVIFAVLLPPVGHLTIQSDAERSSVVWMVLGGVSLSYLVAKEPGDKSGRTRSTHDF